MINEIDLDITFGISLLYDIAYDLYIHHRDNHSTETITALMADFHFQGNSAGANTNINLI